MQRVKTIAIIVQVIFILIYVSKNTKTKYNLKNSQPVRYYNWNNVVTLKIKINIRKTLKSKENKSK